MVLTEIMGSREVNTFGVSSEQLAQRVPGAVVLPSFEAVEEYVTQRAKPGDLVLTLGCGDIYKAAKGMLNR